MHTTVLRWKAFPKFRVVAALCVLFLLGLSPSAHAYSLLTHEQLIDLTWDQSIVPLLRSHYPTLTQAQIEHARAYAYGGCVIQDIGYYPFGDVFFSNLTHYVRTGDFVVNLLRHSGNADEPAFAIGALSHYIGDTEGHSRATNLAVPVEFPKLRARYGQSVTYAQGPHQHVQTEFGFDINESVYSRVAPANYFRHVGLQVPTRQLARAFYETYGLSRDFTGLRARHVNVRAYRFAVHSFLPRIADALTLLHRKQGILALNTPEMMQMNQEITRIAAGNNWELYRRRPGIGTYTLAGVLVILPKVGPLKLVAVKGPTPSTEAEYINSVANVVSVLRRGIARFTLSSMTEETSRVPNDAKHPLKNRDLDTGRVASLGVYSFADRTYAQLLHRLTNKPGTAIPLGIKEDLLVFYADLKNSNYFKSNPKECAIIQTDLTVLRGMLTSAEAEPHLLTEIKASQSEQ